MKHNSVGMRVCFPVWFTGLISLTSLRSSTPPSVSCNNLTNLVASTFRLLRLLWYLGFWSGMTASPSGLCGLSSGSILLEVRGKQWPREPPLYCAVWISCKELLHTTRRILHKNTQPSFVVTCGFQYMLLKQHIWEENNVMSFLSLHLRVVSLLVKISYESYYRKH